MQWGCVGSGCLGHPVDLSFTGFIQNGALSLRSQNKKQDQQDSTQGETGCRQAGFPGYIATGFYIHNSGGSYDYRLAGDD